MSLAAPMTQMVQMAPATSPWPELHTECRAVVVVDVVESVRLMRQREAHFIEQWMRFVRQAKSDVVPRNAGHMVKSLGDGMLLDFADVRSALACARSLIALMAEIQGESPEVEALRLRVGIHLADVVVDEIDIFGSSVNLTARIAGLAGPDEIVATSQTVDQLVIGLDADLDDMGECFLKHIDEPVRAYRLLPPASQRLTWQSTSTPEAATAAGPLARPKIAVLNFDAMDLAPAVGGLVADEVSVQISAQVALDVISRMSLRHAQGADSDALLRRVGAQYAVIGSCSMLNGRVLLWLELLYVTEQQVIWRDRIDTTLATLVAGPADVLVDACRKIMAAISVHEAGRVRSMPLASLDSYSLLLGGVRLMHRLSRRDFDRSHAVFEALTQRHPRHPDGYAWLAKWRILEVHQGWSADPVRSAAVANDLARRALDHDDRCAVAMVVAGMVKTFNDRRLDEAEGIYERALSFHPNEPLAWLLKGMVHAFRGEGQLAVEHTRRASALSPLDPMRYYFDSLGASAEASAGHYEEAVALATRSLQANLMHASTLRILTIAYAMLDRMDEARGTVRKMLQLEPEFNVSRFMSRSPSSDYAIGQTYADAFIRAGLPR